MNKTQLIQSLARHTGLGKDEVTRVVDALFDVVIPTELAAGRSVAIRGFGTFEARALGPRLAKNPATGEPVQVPARRRLALRPARTRT